MIYDKIKNNKAIIIIFLILILVTFLTQFYGSTDIADYSDVAKFFAGEYSAKIRNSHSYLPGFLHSPFVGLTDSYISFKITSLIFLALIIYSVYIMSNRNRKALWLMLLSPVIWYMAPWINPTQLSGLLFLWAYYFIEKYDSTNKIKYLLYSGIFTGLSWAIWDTIFYFGFILAFVFLFNKKLSHSVYFVLFLLIGLMPRLILDYFLFNFPFYSIMKSMMGGFAHSFGGGVYGEGHGAVDFYNLIPPLLSIPLYYWMLYKPGFLKNNKKSIIFLSLCLLLIFYALPQIRYIIALAPIMILLISREINEKQFNRQIIFSIIVILLFIAPYLIQIGYSIRSDEVNGAEFMYAFKNFNNLALSKESPEDILLRDLNKIIDKYPNETFVIGNDPDNYQKLAHIYWGNEIQELVSIQDYNLVLNNKTMEYNPETGKYKFSEADKNLVLYEKTFMPSPNIAERRQIWLAGGINKNTNDSTDYESIGLGIGINEPIALKNFVVIEKYDRLYLSKKIG